MYGNKKQRKRKKIFMNIKSGKNENFQINFWTIDVYTKFNNSISIRVVDIDNNFTYFFTRILSKPTIIL